MATHSESRLRLGWLRLRAAVNQSLPLRRLEPRGDAGRQRTLLQSFRWGTDLSGTPQGAGGVGGLKAVTLHTGTNAGIYFYAYDGNGNVMALLNAATGGKAAEYEYGPFGELLRTSGPLASLNTFRFSTKFCDDESGLYYYGYRYYDPSTGRWPSRDPIFERGGNNVYGFIQNRGINDVDLLGKSSIWVPPGGPLPPDNRPGGGGSQGSFFPGWGPDNCSQAAMVALAPSIGANLGNWRYLHCLANCEIATRCGAAVAESWSNWKEQQDKEDCDEYYRQTGRRDSGKCYSAEQPTDYIDNKRGRIAAKCGHPCTVACDSLKGQPDGPPGPHYRSGGGTP